MSQLEPVFEFPNIDRNPIPRNQTSTWPPKPRNPKLMRPQSQRPTQHSIPRVSRSLGIPKHGQNRITSQTQASTWPPPRPKTTELRRPPNNEAKTPPSNSKICNPASCQTPKHGKNQIPSWTKHPHDQGHHLKLLNYSCPPQTTANCKTSSCNMKHAFN